MANGETFKEIRDLLESEDKISTTVATRLTLSAMADLMKEFKDYVVEDKAQHKAITAQIKILESKNILLWVEKNKAFSGILMVLFLIVFITAPDLIVPMIADAVGVKLP